MEIHNAIPAEYVGKQVEALIDSADEPMQMIRPADITGIEAGAFILLMRDVEIVASAGQSPSICNL